MKVCHILYFKGAKDGETRKRKRLNIAQDFIGTPARPRKRSIERLGSPYTTWYPSPTRRRHTNHPPTYMNE